MVALLAEFPFDPPTNPGKVISHIQIAVGIGYIGSTEFV